MIYNIEIENFDSRTGWTIVESFETREKRAREYSYYRDIESRYRFSQSTLSLEELKAFDIAA